MYEYLYNYLSLLGNILYLCTIISINLIYITMENIIKFLLDHPLISIHGLEKECSMPTGTIRLSMRRAFLISIKIY